MDIRVLRYFVTVAREGSITNAAKFLHVTQPTLSRQLKELEEDLGKQLFIRSTSKLKLTEEGMLLRKRAEDILDMVEKTRDEFRSMDDITGGDIHIGSAETHAMSIIAQAAIDLQTRYSNVRFHIYSGNADEVIERLDRGLLDFCLLVMPVDLIKYNYITLPSKDTWGVVMRKDCPLAAKKSVRVNDLVKLPLICSRQSLDHEIADWFGEKLDGLRIVATYNLFFNASILVEEGGGYMIALDKLVNTGKESNLTFRPLAPKLESGLCLAWKKYQVFSRAEELFLEDIKARFSIEDSE
ncbi:MAG: LysR family transcriptional regulator [Planctomycetaceae bacterium]|nr:LysR family transcriptional regulator [Planctomycetaceae bacterium]